MPHWFPLALLFLMAPIPWSGAQPLPEGSFVDLLVIPVGPVALAEFERDNGAGAASEGGGTPEKASGRPGGGGSGVRVKEQDPAEIPPRAVFLKKGENEHYRIPCFFNAVTTPVRVPVMDTEVVFRLLAPGSSDSFTDLETCRIASAGQRLVVLLTKPLSEKKWTRPKVTLVPAAGGEAPQLLLANASQSLSCGAVLDRTQKILLPPLGHQVWQPAADADGKPVAVALAMADSDQRFQAPFYNDNIVLRKASTTVLVCYDVTPQESFRRGKYALGRFAPGEFRPATIYPEKPSAKPGAEPKLP